MPTLDNDIWTPGSRAPIDWHVTPTIMAAAAGNAAGGRSDGGPAPRLLLTTSGTEEVALEARSDLRVGDQHIRSDTGVIRELGDAGWAVKQTTRALTYTPSWGSTYFLSAGGTTESNFAYWVNGDRVTVFGVVYMGNATVASAIYPVRIPVPSGFPVGYDPGNLGVIGRAVARQSSSAIYIGQVHGMYGDYSGPDTSGKIYPSVIFRGASNDVGMSNVQPFTWSSYPAACLAVQFEYSL